LLLELFLVYAYKDYFARFAGRHEKYFSPTSTAAIRVVL